MSKALMLSIIAATVLIPAIASQHRGPLRALRLTLTAFALFCFVYAAVVVLATPTVEVMP